MTNLGRKYMIKERKAMHMKIEKINDNQIRCTLTKEDLASRQLKLSELAYGTEKAKRLFREMMQQANFEFGFEAEDIPLMIEAIPMNAECVVLLITKVEDPEELDTRFARFSPSNDSYEEGDDFEGYDEELQDRLRPFAEQLKEEPVPDDPARPTRIFVFSSISEVMDAASQIGSACPCPTALYKDTKKDQYLLTISKGEATPEDYGRLCNVLSEYGKVVRGGISEIFLKEHCETIMASNCIQNLAN